MAVGGLPRGSFSSTATFLRLLAASRKPPSSHGSLQQTPRHPFCPQVETPSPPRCWLCSCPPSGSPLPEGDSLWVPSARHGPVPRPPPPLPRSSPTPVVRSVRVVIWWQEARPHPPTFLGITLPSDPLLGSPQVGSVSPSRLLGKPTLVGWEPLSRPR